MNGESAPWVFQFLGATRVVVVSAAVERHDREVDALQSGAASVEAVKHRRRAVRSAVPKPIGGRNRILWRWRERIAPIGEVTALWT